jgi:N utilization substance protein A
VKLFEMEVPEIYDGTVVIKTAVRAPGERAKVAVYSRERDVDPVGACVGMKGSRVQSIIRELRGEKIDIIEHSDDLVTFAQSALAPAKITRVSVTHQGEVPHLDVIVEDEQLSLAIGKRGQNVRLASELLGCKIDVKSESDVKDEVAGALARMLQGEDVTEQGAAIDWSDAPVPAAAVKRLTDAGYTTLDALLESTPETLQQVEGIDAAAAESLREWADEKRTAEASMGLDLSAFSASKVADSSTMADQDFMAALSKAFQETEPSTPASGDSGEEPTGDSTAADSAEAERGEKE